MRTDTKVNWDEVTQLFNLDRKVIQIGASQFITSHPKPVREAIRRYAEKIDASPVWFVQENEDLKMQECRIEINNYFQVGDPDCIALTDSTTMGLGTIYTALNLQAGDEILTTCHDHYSHHESILQACRRTGARYREIGIYKALSGVSKEEIVKSIPKEITEQTRVLGITWVHSGSGLKLPVKEICQAVSELNESRPEDKQIITVVDGVHGFGIELETFSELGCDFFITGCHKWLYGPRGTGFIAATKKAWQRVTPIIPSFTETMDMIIGEGTRPAFMDGKQMTPGGFHSLENRWALTDAFHFINSIGKKAVYERVHALNRMCKRALLSMPHIKLHTPLEDELSAGIVAFEVGGYSTTEAVNALKENGVVATAAPYRTSWVRLTPGISNTELEVEKAISAVWSLKK